MTAVLTVDNNLVDSARRGDRAAFGRLYEQYVRMVHGVLLARVPYGEVDDLMQEVFLVALRELGELREPGRFGGWLATIARNIATDYHRRPKSRSLQDGMLRQSPPAPQSVVVLEALQSLPDAYRETLALRLIEGLTGPEIAAQTGLTPESVRVNLHRGMKILRERLGGSI